MDKYIIEESGPLKGEVIIDGAKNAALPIMAASILTDGITILKNVPNLMDIRTMRRLLEYIGCKIDFDIKKKIMKIDARVVKDIVAPYQLVKTMRASAVILGPLLSRFGKAEVSLPGGCAIGARPLNIHLDGFKKLGADIEIIGGYVRATTTKKLQGQIITLAYQSVGATENLMMAAVLAKGKTEIINAAREPEIVDLANFLNHMGAKIKNAGTAHITITGVKKLKPVEYTVIPDRIEAGTFLTAAALIKNSEIKIRNFIIAHSPAVVEYYRQAGVIIEELSKNSVIVKAPEIIKPLAVKTAPFPAFATDMQPQLCALLCLAQGKSFVSETVFENRFMHISELNRLGANITIDRNTAIITGVDKLIGAQIMATDLRAGAALVIAALRAQGVSEVFRIYHIDRGYDKLEDKLTKLGAKIKRVKTDKY